MPQIPQTANQRTRTSGLVFLGMQAPERNGDCRCDYTEKRVEALERDVFGLQREVARLHIELVKLRNRPNWLVRLWRAAMRRIK